MRAFFVFMMALAGPASAGESADPPLPEFGERKASRWINSDPLSVGDLAGNVVMVELWTFGCGNCVRSLPWLREIEERYRERGLRVVGVHTPEFDYEKDADRLRAFIDKQQISWPNMIDNDFRYWKKLSNRYWPAFYLVDREGTIQYLYIGETHSGTTRAKEIERSIEWLLDEGDAP